MKEKDRGNKQYRWLNKYNQLIDSQRQLSLKILEKKNSPSTLVNPSFPVYFDMIYRNQLMQPSEFSTNYLLNKERKLKYQTHLNKIAQIQNRQFNPKLQAKILDHKILQLTKLKQFSRNFKAKEQQIQRLKHDSFMIEHIKQRNQTKIYPKLQEPDLRKTKSTFKFNSRVVSSSISTKNLAQGVVKNEQVQKENKRLIRSITQNSFDQDKFRKTLKQTTRDYLKVRAHMRRVKGQRQQSLKKLKTQPIEQFNERTRPITLISTSNNDELDEYDLYNKLRNTEVTTTESQKNKQFRKSSHRSKKMFKLNDSLTQIIDKKLTQPQ